MLFDCLEVASQPVCASIYCKTFTYILKPHSSTCFSPATNRSSNTNIPITNHYASLISHTLLQLQPLTHFTTVTSDKHSHADHRYFTFHNRCSDPDIRLDHINSNTSHAACFANTSTAMLLYVKVTLISCKWSSINPQWTKCERGHPQQRHIQPT